MADQKVFPLSMPLEYVDGSTQSADRALWYDALSNAVGKKFAVLYQDDSIYKPGLHSQETDGWHLAIPYLDIETYVIEGGAVEVYINPTVAHQVPSGALVFKDGVQVNVTTITAGKGTWATLVYNAAAQPLEPATKTTLGGVKIGDNVTVQTDGTISIPIASSASAGVSKVGAGLTMTTGILSADVQKVAGVAPSEGDVLLSVSNITGAAPLKNPTFTNAKADVSPAWTDNSKALATTEWGTELYLNRIQEMTTRQLHDSNANALTPQETQARVLRFTGSTGGSFNVSLPVTSGRWLVINDAWNYNNGHQLRTYKQTSGPMLHIPQGGRMEVFAVDTSDPKAQSVFPVPVSTPASASVMGGVKIGSGLNVAADGTITVPSLQPATKTVLGGIKVGAGLNVTPDGVLSSAMSDLSFRQLDHVEIDWQGQYHIDIQPPDSYRRAIVLTGAPTSTKIAYLVASGGLWLIKNATNTDITLQLRVQTAGDGFFLPRGASAWVVGDSTDPTKQTIYALSRVEGLHPIGARGNGYSFDLVDTDLVYSMISFYGQMQISDENIIIPTGITGNWIFYNGTGQTVNVCQYFSDGFNKGAGVNIPNGQARHVMALGDPGNNAVVQC